MHKMLSVCMHVHMCVHVCVCVGVKRHTVQKTIKTQSKSGSEKYLEGNIIRWKLESSRSHGGEGRLKSKTGPGLSGTSVVWSVECSPVL